MLERDAELRAVTGLCRELVKHGLSIGLRDARPAVVVRVRGASPLYVTVDASGEFFEWDQPPGRHRVDDPAGASDRLAALVKARLSEAGDRS